STIALTGLRFGNTTVGIVGNGVNGEALVDLRPAKNLLVKVQVKLIGGLLTVRFVSLDPNTGLPPTDPNAGFLPPNINPPEGEGNVSFTIRTKAGLPTDSQIANQASIRFDDNAPILTPTWVNAIDADRPTSYVHGLGSQQTRPTFVVDWSGTDLGS